MEDQFEQQTLPQEDAIDFYIRRPSLPLRIKSMLIDAVILIGLMFLITRLFDWLEVSSPKIRGGALFLVLLYEPIATAIYQTIGQKISGIRVVRFSNLETNRERKRISFFSSLFRYLAKGLLGWISLLTVTSSKYGQAIHDTTVGSVMVFEE